MQAASRLESGGHKRHPLVSVGPKRCPQQTSLPPLSPAPWLVLGSRAAAAMGGALLPACWREQEAKIAHLDILAQNAFKAFPQIVVFNFTKSYLVALRTLAVEEGRVMP